MRTIFKKIQLLAVCFTVFCSAANAATYTALLSGNFNSALTWGGIIPSSLLTTDEIIIPSGINVTLTGVQEFSGTSILTVNGTLAAAAGSTLVMTSGSLTGSGSITADSMVLGLTSGVTFTGIITANRMRSTGTNVTSAAAITVNNSLYLAAGNLNMAAGSLTMGTNSTITRSGGTLAATGTGSLNLTNMYNVNYVTTSATTGAELNGTGLRNIMVDMAGTVTLAANTAVNGTITLAAGSMNLNGRTLTFNTGGNLAATGSGNFMGSSTSSIIVNATAGLSGMLTFASGSNTLNDLTINTGSGGNVSLGSDVNINGTLALSNGTLSLNGRTFTFNTTGDLSASGTGMLMGSGTSNLIINSTTGLAGSLRFATGGNMLNNLTVNTGSGSNASLGSDLMLNGMLTLSAGTLSLNGRTLTLGTTGNIAAAGSGMIMGSNTSNMVINSTATLAGSLNFATGGNMLNNLTINTGSGSNASLGSDLSIDGMLTLTAGSLSLNGNDLTFNSGSSLAATGTGSLMGNSSSNVIVNATGGLMGTLRFATGSNMLNNFTINTGSANNVTMGSDLTVNGALNLQSGRVRLGSNNLSIATGGNINGGSGNSYVMTNGSGQLMINLAPGTNDTFAVGTATNFAPMIMTSNSGSANGNVGINVADGVLSNGTTGSSMSATGSMVNVTWFVNSTAGAGMNYNMTAMWSAGMEVNGFNRNNAYISHYTAGAWDAQTGSAAGTSGSLYTMTRTGITSLSPFMVTDGRTPTSVSTTAATQVISVYPNPATTTLHITANVEHVAIYDVTGRIIASPVVVNNTVDVSNIPAGTYVIRMTGKDVAFTTQFTKQ